MKKLYKISILIVLIISTIFGLWHFIIPYMFKWYSYIPKAPITLIVSIDWTNFFMALLLSGNSLLLIIFRKRLYERDILAKVFYGFIVFVWLCRIIITVILPWGYDTLFVIQMFVFIIVFLLLLIPLIDLLRTKKR